MRQPVPRSVERLDGMVRPAGLDDRNRHRV